jgi:hypothetical protein
MTSTVCPSAWASRSAAADRRLAIRRMALVLREAIERAERRAVIKLKRCGLPWRAQDRKFRCHRPKDKSSVQASLGPAADSLR